MTSSRSLHNGYASVHPDATDLVAAAQDAAAQDAAAQDAAAQDAAAQDAAAQDAAATDTAAPKATASAAAASRTAAPAAFTYMAKEHEFPKPCLARANKNWTRAHHYTGAVDKQMMTSLLHHPKKKFTTNSNEFMTTSQLKLPPKEFKPQKTVSL